jgi:hypothetical protein
MPSFAIVWADDQHRPSLICNAIWKLYRRAGSFFCRQDTCLSPAVENSSPRVMGTPLNCPGARRHCLRVNISTVLAGQKLGIKEVDDGIWLTTFLDYELGYTDLEQKALQTIDNPFGPRLLRMS